MEIKHPNCKLVVGCLLAAMLLPACGGSSSSSGGTGSSTYQQGYAKGTVDTLDIVLTDLRALQTSLAGSGAPAQTSRGTLGRSFALLEPRQRETLAASLLTFIERVTEARNAAAAATAGTDEARAAQAATNQALQALQLVIEADTAARVSGGEAAQEEAIAALNAIARVDASAPDATTRIDAVLEEAVRAARNEVAELEAELARLQTQLGQQESDAGDLASLRQQVGRLQAELTAARSNLADAAWRARGVKPGFGAVTASTASTTGRPATVTFHRRTARAFAPTDYLNFQASFDPHGTPGTQGAFSYTGASNGLGVDPDNTGPKTAWAATDNAFAPPATAIDLDPDAVLYAAGQKQVVATDPSTAHFRARGTVFRANWRNPPRYVADAENYVFRTGVGSVADNAISVITAANRVSSGTAINPLINAKRRHQTLIIQGQNTRLGTDAGRWSNSAQTPYTTFRYDAADGLTMGFGGDGAIFADLERYQAKGCPDGSLNCNNAVTANIEISFGAPDFDPAGQGMFHWSADVVTPRLKADGTAAETPPGRDHGQYNLLLSNGAGAGRRQLSYAAYGLFNFRDGLYNPGPRPEYGRVQTFHYGLEAFADDSGRRVSDMDRIAATFRGLTHGWVLTRHANAPGVYGTLTRLRGDVTLTANIGGAQNDTISGMISGLRQSPAPDLETQPGSGAAWTAGRLPETVMLQGAYTNGVIGVAPILATTGATTTAAADFAGLGVAHGALGATAAVGADGTFAGTVTASGERADNWERGEYEGALYGPTSALEAAGTWWLQAHRGDNNADLMHPAQAIIGSFGAVCATGCN